MPHDHHDHHDHRHAHDHDGAGTGDAPLGLAHVEIRSHRPDALADWYEDVLGLTRAADPDGALLLGPAGAPMLVLRPAALAPLADPDQLRLDAVAFRGADLDAFLARVHALGVTFGLGRGADGQGAVVDLTDPDDNRVRVMFPL